ncbi:5315_t:CDS:2 [Acaulospora morrowiae]|uniref:5315_t:CDS:1 n=1 Tax=Acaulospora morrowiae TaxID=94023 RepID=A0A9N8Z6W1_9GLOM|nr:5315_t:CDS:2 [Acaulospora morrowiae]
MSFQTRARSDSGYGESIEIHLNVQSRAKSPSTTEDAPFSNYLGLESSSTDRRARRTDVVDNYIPFFTSFPLEYVCPPKNNSLMNKKSCHSEGDFEEKVLISNKGDGKCRYDETPIPGKCLISINRNIQNLQEAIFKMRILREKLNSRKLTRHELKDSLGSLRRKCYS